MPAMAQNRERMNLGEYAEEATIIVDEPVRPAKQFHWSQYTGSNLASSETWVHYSCVLQRQWTDH